MHRTHANLADLPALVPVAISAGQDNALPEILDAAVRVFDERGYSHASISEIAERADVSKSLVCYFFPSKASIAVTVINLAYPDGVFMGVERTEEDPLDAIIWSAHHVTTNAFRSPLARVALALRDHPDVRGWPAPPSYCGWLGRITDYLVEARSGGRIDPAAPARREARLILGAITGIITLARSTGDVVNVVADVVEVTQDRLNLLETRAPQHAPG
ncbi:TetR/AcrR family transcriptional regulator [Microbacterium sp. VKM Ac-2870]|uniref:TetR/AcrR family transcriptional regulator n=1 Tax=Microbacterium sp. VKM Ac-2870 TaxID=2783825 RepID=UPI00188D5722|nr:TetR/AcrR family transcriptional regulator [Microbacterium sp. VKM Ac-2870]MBF4562875.1 TetR/AcrR family transcriptional regulator [Microbacterium sp. VKM Ac-2870]